MVCVAAAWSSQGQDVHFSQFYESAILRNPALTGIFTSDYKVGVMHRNQWSSIGPGSYRTTVGTAEVRLPINNHVNDYITVGMLGYLDKAGRVDFQTMGFYPAINYNKSLEDEYSSYLSVGFTGGYIQRSIDLSKMTFDNQYQNGGFDPTYSNGEANMPDPKLNHWDLGAGVSFNSSVSEDLSYFLGVAAYHFTKPRRSFYANNELIRLDTRWNGNAGIHWIIDDAYSVQLHVNYIRQGAHQEIIVGGLGRWSRFDVRNRQTFALYIGAFYRYKDALVPTLKVDYKGQTFAISYDVNTSTLRPATNMRGGVEFSVFSTGFFGGGGPEERRTCPRF